MFCDAARRVGNQTCINVVFGIRDVYGWEFQFALCGEFLKHLSITNLRINMNNIKLLVLTTISHLLNRTVNDYDK